MSKKDKKQEIVMTPDNGEIKLEDEPMFESEAYAAPQPEAGSDVTVLKPVGTGGPVPIVAPKHNTIQLQPIVVPLAVVPYMTQDSNVLRTDGRGQNVYAQATVENDEATDFETVSARKVKKKGKVQPRIFALVTFLLSALTVLPFILSYFIPSVGSVSIEKLNVIGVIKNWIDNGFCASSAFQHCVHRCCSGQCGYDDCLAHIRHRGEIPARVQLHLCACVLGSNACFAH